MEVHGVPALSRLRQEGCVFEARHGEFKAKLLPTRLWGKEEEEKEKEKEEEKFILTWNDGQNTL